MKMGAGEICVETMKFEMQIVVCFRYEKKVFSNSNSSCVYIVIYGKFGKYLHSQRSKDSVRRRKKRMENQKKTSKNAFGIHKKLSKMHV